MRGDIRLDRIENVVIREKIEVAPIGNKMREIKDDLDMLRKTEEECKCTGEEV